MGKGYTATKISIPSGNYRMKLLILSSTVNRQSRAKRLVTEYGAVVISTEYCLAGKAPYPAALEDCYYSLLYLKEHAPELGCTDDRIHDRRQKMLRSMTDLSCWRRTLPPISVQPR